MTINSVQKYLRTLKEGEHKIFYALPNSVGACTASTILSNPIEIYPIKFIPYYVAVKKEANDTYYVNVGSIDNYDNTLIEEDIIKRKLLNYASDIPFRELDELYEIGNQDMFFNRRHEAWRAFETLLAHKEQFIKSMQLGIDYMVDLSKKIKKTNPEMYV